MEAELAFGQLAHPRSLGGVSLSATVVAFMRAKPRHWRGFTPPRRGSARGTCRLTVVVLLGFLLSGGSAFAHGGGDVGGAGQRQTVSRTPPSEGFLDAWDALLAAREDIAGGIEAGRSDRIHHGAGAILGIAQSLEPTGDLNGAQRKRVRSGLTQLWKVAEHLQTVADAGDGELLRGDLIRIDRALRLIRAQYPKDSLPVDRASDRRE